MSTPTVKSHAKFSASSSSRWLNCPGSVALCADVPPGPESPYAKEGTEAHDVLERLFKNIKLTPDTPSEMIVFAKQAKKTIESRAPSGAPIISEMQVKLDFIHPDFGGTFDAAILEHFGHLQVFDYKYGAGVPVDAVNNTQMIVYGLGLAHLYDYNFSEITLTIIQPRADHHSGETVRDWTLDMHSLYSWADTFKKAIDLAESRKGRGIFNAGPWCRWCEGCYKCPALIGEANNTAVLEFDTQAAIAPFDIERMLNLSEKITTWAKAVKFYAHQYLKAGGEIPGYKLVNRRGTRQWNDPALVAKKFGETAFEKKIVSPAKLEKLAPNHKAWIKQNCAVVSSGDALVKTDDNRESIDQIALDFTPSVNDDTHGEL